LTSSSLRLSGKSPYELGHLAGLSLDHPRRRGGGRGVVEGDNRPRRPIEGRGTYEESQLGHSLTTPTVPTDTASSLVLGAGPDRTTRARHAGAAPPSCIQSVAMA